VVVVSRSVRHESTTISACFTCLQLIPISGVPHICHGPLARLTRQQAATREPFWDPVHELPLAVLPAVDLSRPENDRPCRAALDRHRTALVTDCVGQVAVDIGGMSSKSSCVPWKTGMPAAGPRSPPGPGPSRAGLTLGPDGDGCPRTICPDLRNSWARTPGQAWRIRAYVDPRSRSCD
jgi:hypothetical protein